MRPAIKGRKGRQPACQIRILCLQHRPIPTGIPHQTLITDQKHGHLWRVERVALGISMSRVTKEGLSLLLTSVRLLQYHQVTSHIVSRRVLAILDPRRSSASCFWTGGSPNPRRRSSVNRLLRGHTAFEPEEQEPVFSKTRSRASSGSSTSASGGLPPPPVKLSKHEKLSFGCDICGRTVLVEDRLDWQ